MKNARYLWLLGFAMALWSCTKDKPWDADPQITLSQEGKPLEKLFLAGSSEAQDVQVVVVKSVKAWTIDIPQEAAQWLSVEPSAGGTGTTEVKFTAQPNKTYGLRSADLKLVSGSLVQAFTVTQSQNDALILSEPVVDLQPEGGDFEIVVKANLNYTVEITAGADWISQVQAQSPGTRSLTENTLKFHAGEYVDFEKNREGSIVIKATDSGLSQKIPVIQMSIDTDLPNLYIKEAGTLQQEIFNKTTEPWALTELNVIGKINAADISYIASNMTALKVLKLHMAEIDGGILPDKAFYNNQTLLEFTFPKNTGVIGEQALGNCKSLGNELALPEGLKEIRKNGLYYAGFTGELKLPQGLTTIGEGAFYGCESLGGGVVIPEGITDIPASAFRLCAISSLTLPKGLKSIGDYAFSCPSLGGSLELPQGLTSVGANAFSGAGFTGDLEIPSTVTTIGAYAFRGAAFNGKLTLPSGLTEVPDYAFSSCPFVEIQLPDGLTGIGASAFQGAKITSLKIPASLKTVGGFSDCTELASLTIPEGVETIDASAFSGCKSLTGALRFPSSLKSVGAMAFQNCAGLTGTVTLPQGMASVPDRVLNGCTGITGVVLPSTVAKIERQALAGTGITSIVLPSGLVEIDSDAFKGCLGLTAVQIPDGVISLGGFQGCTNLATINIPSTVTTIASNAFKGCTGLTSLAIPSSVTKVGQYSFQGCGLKTLTVPASIQFGSSNYGLFQDNVSLEMVVIADGVTTLPANMFQGCTALKSVSIPSSVVSIGGQCFMGCSSLASVVLPAGLTKLEYNVFWSSGLTSVDIPEGVTTIGASCFSDCQSLASVTIPSTVTSISNYAFNGAPLTAVSVKAATPPTLGRGAFSDVPRDISVYVPTGAKTAYQSADYWSEFTNITEKSF